MTPEELLAAYDADLREEGEFPPSVPHQRHGPVLWVHFPRRGFVTYRDLAGFDPAAIESLVAETTTHFRAETDYAEVEWKTRGHDHVPGLVEALGAHGWEPDEVETVMAGDAAALAVGPAPPAGVVLRRAGDGGDLEDDVRRLLAMQEAVFGPDTSPLPADVVRVSLAGEEEYWLAEASVDGRPEVVSAVRLTPVPETRFAGLWGGATLPGWRGRGIYRALVAARAEAAVQRGVDLLHSDCTALSRPILERSGLVAITTTTPYRWRR